MSAESRPRTGVWIIGARGAVATTTIVGARAVARDLSPLRGVTTEGARGEGLSLPAASALVFGVSVGPGPGAEPSTDQTYRSERFQNSVSQIPMSVPESRCWPR